MRSDQISWNREWRMPNVVSSSRAMAKFGAARATCVESHENCRNLETWGVTMMRSSPDIADRRFSPVLPNCHHLSRRFESRTPSRYGFTCVKAWVNGCSKYAASPTSNPWKSITQVSLGRRTISCPLTVGFRTSWFVKPLTLTGARSHSRARSPLTSRGPYFRNPSKQIPEFSTFLRASVKSTVEAPPERSE